jgi:hypothetical protein
VVVRNGNQYRDAYFLFGSACRILAGKVPLKEWQATVEDIWRWSKRKVEELQIDVPDFASPVQEASAPQPEEPSVEYINDIQAKKFKDRCLKLGLAEAGIRLILKDHGIDDIAKIPLEDFESLWYLVRSAAPKTP